MTAQHTKHAKHTKRKRRRRSPLRILIILILVIAVLVGLTLSTVHKKLGKISTKSLDQSQLVTVNKDSNMTDYTNYAFFGIDSQTGSMSDRGNRSDSIIVVSINNSTKDVKLLSIYRDTYVSINGKYSKINAAYSWGGPELAISTINRNLDLNIEKYATVNFRILADIVDAVGGIEVKVDKSILKNLNAYIGDMNRINGGHSPKLSSAGTYTLDGNQAVAYSRIRYTAGGDLARAGRQREVLQKIFDKAKKNPLKMMSVMDEILPQVKTNMSQDELFDMFLSVFKYDIKDQQGFPWDQKELRYYGTYYGFPTTLKENAIRAHKYSLVHRIIKSVMSLAVSIRRSFIVLDINPEYQLKMQKRSSRSMNSLIDQKLLFILYSSRFLTMFLQPFPGLLCSKRNPLPAF